MNYEIVIEKRARKFIQKLPKPEKERILKAISKLPSGNDIKQLQGHVDFFRLRVGEYRIIYTQNHTELIICIVDAGNRGDIYKRY
ncbi:type II toxin-antitoxin system RelE/ParE family toxin [Muricomes intestini]|jgi:mRNA interferase RelE/StbE|uniref:type II toxin-antitoxin system RelE family toxin n=1 Tax=Muricomes intestini TaxID=1796634 RepID=UPI002FDE06D8